VARQPVTTQIHPQECVDKSQTPSAGSSANHIEISTNLGAATLIVVSVLAAVIGACGVVMGLNLSEQAAMKRESQFQAATLEREFERNTASQEKEVERLGAAEKDEMDKLQRQYRMTELKLDDWTVVAHRSGLILPGDYTRGPQGNPDSESFQKQKGK
jgi:uncharacterized protein HemX